MSKSDPTREELEAASAARFTADAARISETLGGAKVNIRVGPRWGTVTLRFRSLQQYRDIQLLLAAHEGLILNAQWRAFREGVQAAEDAARTMRFIVPNPYESKPAEGKSGETDI